MDTSIDYWEYIYGRINALTPYKTLEQQINWLDEEWKKFGLAEKMDSLDIFNETAEYESRILDLEREKHDFIAEKHFEKKTKKTDLQSYIILNHLTEQLEEANEKTRKLSSLFEKITQMYMKLIEEFYEERALLGFKEKIWTLKLTGKIGGKKNEA